MGLSVETMGLSVDSGDRSAGIERPDQRRSGLGPNPRAGSAGLSAAAWGALQPLLSALPGPECVAVLLRFRDAVPQSGIAARMGVSPAQVELLLGTALARLREQL